MSAPKTELTRTANLHPGESLDQTIEQLGIEERRAQSPKATVKTGWARIKIFGALVGGAIALLGADGLRKISAINDLRARNYALQPKDFGNWFILRGCIVDCQAPDAKEECFYAAIALSKKSEPEREKQLMEEIVAAAAERFKKEPKILGKILLAMGTEDNKPQETAGNAADNIHTP